MKRKRAFTLLELLVVLVILGLLAALVGPRLIGKVGKAKSQIARSQIALLESALDQYRLDMGHYPTTEEGLKALVEPPANEEDKAKWQGPYLKKRKVPLDPWGRPYHYRSPGEHGDYDLWTYGADGKPGGEGEDADITSWE
ncbi:general secretion pathway protein G [Thermodesulfatator indicus DSM 15286]|uniref:Type II secretion system core protein G n=1 Tax=Thermodesulfatator indicus (strain DSM 15286 / JCM 11887 / CIR29812) TaxID=667014 RepID=F8ADF7_THEID|nr:type II secretion system major pseudopilin GspG [Thermodesulfatator indicus]AEH45973.1 general secretion pathway protein G [Thermodesulfatator indicus DSM 15286]